MPETGLESVWLIKPGILSRIEGARQPELVHFHHILLHRIMSYTVTDHMTGAAISQSLAGRTNIHHLLPLSLEELSPMDLVGPRNEVLVRGILRRLYDASVEPGELYSSYFATYVERDVRRMMDVGVSPATPAGWLSTLEASFVVIRIHPFHANLGKRLVKTPKLYFTEPSLLSWLLQIESSEQVSRDPLLGGIYENMVVVEAVKAAYNRGVEPLLSFYRDKSALEIDLIREYQRRPFAMEIKADATFVPDVIRALKHFRSLHADLSDSTLNGQVLAWCPADGPHIGAPNLNVS